ncbi:MAG: aminoacyl-histidine dipeptidase [Breznakibacter sp.]
MTKEILGLEPKLVWAYFHELTQIPRPSKKEQKAVDFAVDFAKKHKLEFTKDDVGNVIVRKPATKGMENRKGVILQAHLDMVPQKNSDKVHDFEKDPIETRVVDSWVMANQTTLGADNGIGAASIFAVLASDNIVHGPIEALLTIDEETGMTGANNLRAGMLQGHILINTDSEDEGELYVGCAGGSNASCTFYFQPEKTPVGTEAFVVSLGGLKGGHSGIDIILGRGNANKLVFRFLKYAVAHLGVRLASIDGGSLRNAIPREAFATVVVPSRSIDDFKEAVADFEHTFKDELHHVEPGLKFEAVPTQLPVSIFDEITQDDLINAVQACPNGVIRMSDSMPGLVETSTNLAVVKSDERTIQVLSLIRSSVDSAKEDVESTIESIFRLAGAEVRFHGQYPGWQPNMDSAILKTMQNVYKNKFGKTPEIKAIHAGLECGILGGVYPHWDMISFGPTIRYPHSPDEKVNIQSVQRFWEFLVDTLAHIPLK